MFSLYRFISHTFCAFTLSLLWASASHSQNSVPTIEETKMVPPQLEWNREIIAANSGPMPCYIKNRNGGITIIVMAERSYKALVSKNRSGMVREDIVFYREIANGEFRGEIDLPRPDNYWFILKNDSKQDSTISLTCFKHRVGSS